MSRAFVREDADNDQPEIRFTLPAADDPGYDAAAAFALLEGARADAIVAAADEVLAGKHAGEFPLSVWQTGSGTQSNMNVNEVLANRASELMGGPRGQGRLVHPNDDVNRSQSSNDVVPSAINLGALLTLERRLLPALHALRAVLDERANTGKKARLRSKVRDLSGLVSEEEAGSAAQAGEIEVVPPEPEEAAAGAEDEAASRA